MNISDIDAQIKGQLPTVILSPATFGNDPALMPLLQQFFSETGGLITITGVQPTVYKLDQDAQTITFTGVGQGGPFDRMTLGKVLIKLVEGAPQLVVEATAPDGWRLSQSFPDLNSPALQQLPFQTPQLFWSSYDSDVDDTIKGFYFEGNLDMNAPPLNLLSFLFPGLTAPLIWGQIDMVGSTTETITQYVPDMLLMIDASQNSGTLCPFTLFGPQLKILSNPFFNTFDNNWQSNNFVKISSMLKFKSSWIPFGAEIKDLNRDILFEASLNAPLGAALSELSDFVGGAALGVPAFHLSAPDDLLLKNITVGFSPGAAQKVKFIALEVGTSDGEKWQLWSDKIFLESINLIFRILPGDTGTQVEGEIYGVVSGWLNLRAAFTPDGNYSFYGGLAQPLALKDAYTFFTGQTITDLPDVNVDSLYLQLNLPPAAQRASYGYAGELTLAGDWPVITQPTAISLRGVIFRFSHDPQAADTTFEAAALIDISDYAVATDAVYDTNLGWVFKGDLSLIGENDSLASLGSKMDESFPVQQGSAPSIPNFLNSWVVENVSADFSTKSKDFNFVADVKNSALPALDLDFGIHLQNTPTAFSREFDGKAVYANDKLSVEFDLSVKEETTGTPASKTSTITGTYKAVNPPKLSDLLQAISQDAGVDVNLPAELNLNAEADSLAFIVEQRDSDEPVVEVAGVFTLHVEGSDLHFNLAYTNKTTFDQASEQTPPALAPNGKRAYVLGVALGEPLDFSHLPLIGSIPGIDELRIVKLGFYYTNAQFAQAGQQLYFQVPEVSGSGQLAPNPTSAVVSKSGFSLSAILGRQSGAPLSGTPLSAIGRMPIPVGTGSPPQSQPTTFTADAARPASPVKWIDINKTFGPVSLKQVGLNYAVGEATIGFSAGFALGGFALGLQGLAITFPMPLPGQAAGHSVSFDLAGMSLDMQKGALNIGGAFLKVSGPQGPANEDVTSYLGEAIVQVGTFNLKALGGYTPSPKPSFFLYVNIQEPIGGPPYMFITGLAGGFGINSSLILPTLDTLPDCVLLPAKAPAQGASPADTIGRVLPKLSGMFKADPGEYWLAAGVQFTSFEMIEAFALLTVAFGVDLQIGLLGTCSMTYPKGDPSPVAYIEIDILASLNPSSGLLAVTGKLSPASYIYGGFCKLTGGFAFYTWFGGEHKGEFVVTIGGYHPAFVPPDYYPQVPRLEMNFSLGSLQVNGQSYFALTPAMMMAGVRLSATWNEGPVSAWFDAGVDFLLSWSPFHYAATAYVSIGCSVDLFLFTIHADVGASLSLWGPPFGGQADVDLDVTSFTISFGASQRPPVPVSWSELRANFLPKDSAGASPLTGATATQAPAAKSSIIKATVSRGLLRSDVQGFDWIIDRDRFAIVTNSAIPANQAEWAGASTPTLSNARADYNNKKAAPYLSLPEDTFDATNVWNPSLNIAPMSLQAVRSFHSVEFRMKATDGSFSAPVTWVSVQPMLLGSSAALWSQSAGDSPNIESLVPSTLTGFNITPIPRFPSAVSNIQLLDLLFAQGFSTGFTWQAQAADTTHTVQSTETPATPTEPDTLTIQITGAGAPAAPVTSHGFVLNALADSWIAGQRAAILSDLRANGFQTLMPDEVHFTDIGMAARKALVDWPMVRLLGGV